MMMYQERVKVLERSYIWGVQVEVGMEVGIKSPSRLD